ncbi:hypothetical protein GCM10027275_42850 [Rhabdobacter roseus]|uniref:Uncharacterized protein n=1 Tax=Rhabdobacter roseus TaxID=1655419 RepID=A0A840TRV8_9BACT|nr:hypothetical protein [Rhabdobacter roseus]MBB5286661.1 hypothetical protein [Rhabdobacter roseus]
MEATEFWSGYLKLVIPLLVGYYGLIVYWFYRQELKVFWAGTRGRAPTDAGTAAPPVPTEGAGVENGPVIASSLAAAPGGDPREETLLQVEELAAYLRQAIAEAHEKAYDRQELILLIELTLKEYPGLVGTSFRHAINHLIETECAKYGRIHLEAEVVAQMWEQVN